MRCLNYLLLTLVFVTAAHAQQTDERLANLGMVCLQRKNRDCVLTEYNYLKLNSDSLAQKLFNSMYSSKVVDVAAYRNKPRR